MILHRLASAIREQNWATVAIELFIVVLGVFLGLQANNWNEARVAEHRREQIVAALVTDLRDAMGAQQGFIDYIDEGMAAWNEDFEAGNLPPPFYFRHSGSDTAPNTWATLQQMQLTDMFDPSTIFDLGFYYSELQGVGVKVIRYVTFVESNVLPNLKRDPAVFYTADHSALLPEYAANMDRLADYRTETERLQKWANCLVFRLQADRSFDQSCRRTDYLLEGMQPMVKPE